MPNDALLKLRADQLAADTATAIRPVYLLSGDETLLVNEAADTLRAACRRDGFSERVVLNADRGFDWSEFEAELNGLSLFNDRRIVELRLPSAKPLKKGKEALVRAVERPAADTVLLVLAPKLDKTAQKADWVSAIDAVGAHVQIWPIDDSEFASWVAARMRGRGLEPTRDAVHAFCARVEGNLLAAAQEIDKLWLHNGDGPVSVECIAATVGDNARFNVFKLADTVLSGHQRKAFRVLRALRLEGAEPVLVTWALTKEIRTLYSLAVATSRGQDQAAAMRSARVWGTRQGLVRAAMARHTQASLTALMYAAAAADRAARGRGSADVWDHITGLVFALSGGASEARRGAA